MTAIKIIHLAKDNELDGMTCTQCGASLKHAIEINGATYGFDCGAQALGWKQKNIKARVDGIEWQVRNFKKWYSAYQAGKASKGAVEVAAAQTAQLIGLTVKFSDPEMIEKVYRAVQ